MTLARSEPENRV